MKKLILAALVFSALALTACGPGTGTGDDTPGVKWLMGEDIPGIGAIRDMENPAAFGDPDRIGSVTAASGPTMEAGNLVNTAGISGGSTLASAACSW